MNILDDLFGDKLYKYWTEVNIRKYVEEYDIKTRSQLFTQNQSAYNAANRLKILDELFGEKHNWTKEECAELASECKYRSEFAKKYQKAYAAALKYGWLDDITKHMPKQKGYVTLSLSHNYVVYVYEDTKNKAAYVGLTNETNRRDNEHRFPKSKRYDSLATWCIIHDIPVPQMKILEYNLTAEQAGEKEKEYWYKYRDEGWTMINTEKVLGSLGGSSRKWTEDTIRQFIKDNDIKSRSELRNAVGAYDTARRLGILDDLFGEKELKWTEDTIRQFIKDNDIKSRNELFKNALGAYHAARRLGILDDLFGEKKIKWTEDTIRQFIKDNNIKSRSELTDASESAYKTAIQLGILDDLFGEKKLKNWTEDTIRQFIEDNDIKSRNELYKNALGAYNAARRLGILYDLFGEKKLKNWTEDTIRQFIKDNDIKSRRKLMNASGGAYNAARRLGILDDLFGEKVLGSLGGSLGSRSRNWTEDTIRQFIKDNDIKSRSELKNASGSAYKTAIQLGILDDLFGEKKLKNWTEDTIRQFIKDNDIKSRSELMNASGSAYHAARRLGILDDLFGEKELKWTEESIRQFVKDNNIKTRSELENKASGAYDVARRLGILDDLFGEKKINR